MGYNLDDTNSLKEFLNNLLSHQEFIDEAINLIKFFIVTRNYGLIDLEDNLTAILNGENIYAVIIRAITKGCEKEGKTIDLDSLVAIIIRNYHENGFYFHSFPGVYKGSIEKDGILASNRNSNADKFNELMRKYKFGQYFEKVENRICVTERMDNFSTYEYAIFTPKWLDMFLKFGYGDFRDIYEKGDLDEMLEVAKESLIQIKEYLKQNPDYDEKDYAFLVSYITDVVRKRFANGNDTVGIALIPKAQAEDYFGKCMTVKERGGIVNYLNDCGYNFERVISFLLDSFVKGEIVTKSNIPANLVEIISYNIKRDVLSKSK